MAFCPKCHGRTAKVKDGTHRHRCKKCKSFMRGPNGLDGSGRTAEELMELNDLARPDVDRNTAFLCRSLGSDDLCLDGAAAMVFWWHCRRLVRQRFRDGFLEMPLRRFDVLLRRLRVACSFHKRGDVRCTNSI